MTTDNLPKSASSLCEPCFSPEPHNWQMSEGVTRCVTHYPRTPNKSCPDCSSARATIEEKDRDIAEWREYAADADREIAGLREQLTSLQSKVLTEEMMREAARSSAEEFYYMFEQPIDCRPKLAAIILSAIKEQISK